MELNKTGTTTVRYTQAPRGYGDVISQRRSGVSTYWHFDAIGSMRFLTAADQSKAINYVYDAFGITRSVSGTTTNRFRYIGKLGYYLEPALGCYYLRRRYYVHWLGRFLGKDPLRQGGENAYGYVNNRPTTATDASGALPAAPWYCWLLCASGPPALYLTCVKLCRDGTIILFPPPPKPPPPTVIHNPPPPPWPGGKPPWYEPNPLRTCYDPADVVRGTLLCERFVCPAPADPSGVGTAYQRWCYNCVIACSAQCTDPKGSPTSEGTCTSLCADRHNACVAIRPPPYVF